MTALICAALAMLAGHDDSRLGASSRTDQAGWIYLHLQGAPRDIGYQYGYLAAREIDDAHHAAMLSFAAQPYDWRWARDSAKALFWDKLDPEYREEIEGQAEGLRARGFDDDAWDVLAYNAQIELRDYYIPYLRARQGGRREGVKRDSCSAFIATGSTTKDGRIVMGHNLWWDYVMGQRCNVILDITPKKGHCILMDAFCGFIHSGSDFAINSAGIVVCETTITGFEGFDPKGAPELQRMRKAIQYGDSLQSVARILSTGNNGGYANTWLIGDTTTNEIGKLELGLKNIDFVHKTDGYYVGANFPENPKLIAEEVPAGWDKDPKTNGCEDRRLRWNTLLTENRGKVDVAMAKVFEADTYDQANDLRGASASTLCGRVDAGGFGAMNTKVVDSAMATQFRFWAKMGFSDGSTLNAAQYLRDYPAQSVAKPFLHDIKDEPWTIFPPDNPTKQ